MDISIQNVSKSVNTNLTQIDTVVNNKIAMLIKILIFISIAMITIELILAYIMFDTINNSLKSVKNGLNEFFDFINYKKESISKIEVKTKDEFYEMALEINKNIDNSINTLENNKQIINETNDIIHKISNGFFSYHINEQHIISPDMKKLVTSVNLMILQTKNKFDIIMNALENYGEYNFNYQVDQNALKERLNGDFGSLVASTKLIGNNISEFLAMIMNTGDQLNIDTTKLNTTVEKLTNSSNNQTLSLEKSVQTLEDITNTINQNTNNSKQMSILASEVSTSTNDGYTLATKTVEAMNDITNEVTSIHEAIDVIDKIAFQTNILSLNAAVESATAGEAGKGFAVVAAEVRNLANRSAEAAKQIKSLVEKANEKTASGKNIAQNMIEGYKKLSEKIQNTTTLVQELEISSKLQQEGINKINQEVTVLEDNVKINNKNAQDINSLSIEITQLSQKLFEAASKSNYNIHVREQVCDVDLVYQTAKLKNDVIRFKNNHFTALKEYKNITVQNHEKTLLGEWIIEQEQKDKKFINASIWSELKALNIEYAQIVQEYITKSAQKVQNSELVEISSKIEELTLHIFNQLNAIKILNCK